jgi:D-arginine dehydrogenase
MAESEFDVVVIGAGIAGASVAAHLAEHVSVRLVEMENQPGYHSTGRSAAQFSEFYGNAVIRGLSRASRDFFFAPPAGFCSSRLVTPRPVLKIATESQRDSLDKFARSAAADPAQYGVVESLSPERALELCPILRSNLLVGALLENGPADVDVHELHQGYLKLFRARGGSLTTDARVLELQHSSRGWRVATVGLTLRAGVVVNAAGAWAGEIGKLAGARDIGLQPLRRTALMVDPPAGRDIGSWPMVMDVDENFYLKPDAGQLMLSPADETPSDPRDAQPEEIDIATAVDHIERATTLDVTRVRRKWAGLRSFVRDRSPVVGYDPARAGFFWLAALGGYGIQTSPALSALASALVLERAIDPRINACGVDLGAIAPGRF